MDTDLFPWPGIGALLALALAAIAVLAVFAVYAFGSKAQRRQGAPSLALEVRDGETELDRTIAPLTGQHAGESGLALLTASLAALQARLWTARAAGRSLVVHRDPDDYASQPAGNSGPRVACGVITPAR